LKIKAKLILKETTENFGLGVGVLFTEQLEIDDKYTELQKALTVNQWQEDIIKRFIKVEFELITPVI